MQIKITRTHRDEFYILYIYIPSRTYVKKQPQKQQQAKEKPTTTTPSGCARIAATVFAFLIIGIK